MPLLPAAVPGFARRILSLVVKELRVIFSDPQSRKIVFVPVLLQVCLFPFAATMEVKNATLAVLNEDGGRAAHELAERFSHTAAFTRILALQNERQMTGAIDRQAALAAVRIPPDFSRKLAAGQAVPLQILLDGRRSNSSQIAASYLGEIVAAFAQGQPGSVYLSGLADGGAPVVRHRYNPNLDYKWFVLPSLVAIILTIGSLITTALSVARERELGTFDQLLVSPLTLEMMMLGKAIPALLIGLGQATVILVCAVVFYRIPFAGSLLLFYGSALFYFLSLVGFGLLISAISSTQQQAFLGTFSFMMPCVLLSGFAAPVENMPHWLQTVTWLNPIRHFMVIVKSIFLKDASIGFVLHHALPLAIIAVLTLGMALFIFRRKFA